LVRPISGQDRGGQNLTTDNFFRSFDLENQPKDKKIDTFWDNEAKQREILQEFKPARQRDENSSILGFTKDLTVVTYVPKKNKSVSSFHHSIMIQQTAAIQESLK
jgi:hypothetical protein